MKLNFYLHSVAQLGIALSKTKLNDDLNKKNRYEKIINTIIISVHRSINLQNVLENAVEAMNKNIDGVKKRFYLSC